LNRMGKPIVILLHNNIARLRAALGKTDPTILVALIAHHTPAITSCDDTSYISTGNLFCWTFIYPPRRNQMSPWTRASLRPVSPSRTSRRYQFPEFRLALRSVSYISFYTDAELTCLLRAHLNV
jgi:hypothetical protein